MAFVYIHPSVPFKGYILEGLSPGSEFIIQGQIPIRAGRFSVNLCGQHDVTFHMGVRFDDCCIVRNHLVCGEWGPEERNPHGLDELASGKTFEMAILVLDTHFEVSLNGMFAFDFAHRLPFQAVRTLFIDGDVSLNSVEYTVNECQDAPPPYSVHTDSSSTPPTVPIAPSGISRPFRNPGVPFLYPVLGGLQPGYVIKLIGKPTNRSIRFRVDLLCGRGPFPPSDIALHFNPRFDQSEVVRNSHLDGNWGPEETSGPPFPFRKGANFEVIIKVHEEYFELVVDGRNFGIYKHRIKPVNKTDYFNVTGDVEIFQLDIQRTPLPPPTTLGQRKPSLKFF